MSPRDIERLRALEQAVELVAKATPGPWKQVGSTHSYGIGGDFTPGAFSLVAGGTSGKDCDAVVAAVNFIREHGSALIAELGQEVGADWSDWFETWAKARGMTMQLTADGRFLCPDTALAQSAHEAGCMVSHMYYMELCRQEELAKTSPAHTSEARDAAAKFVERVESVASFLVGYGEAAEVAASGLRGALFDYDAAMRQEAGE